MKEGTPRRGIIISKPRRGSLTEGMTPKNFVEEEVAPNVGEDPKINEDMRKKTPGPSKENGEV